MNNIWEKVKLGNISSMQYGFTASAKREKVGPKLLRITDIVNDNINWSTVPYCKIDDGIYNKYKIEDRDIVIARTGATAGYAKLIKDPPEAVFASYLIRVKFNQKCIPGFGGKLIESVIFKNFIKHNISGSAQPHANAPILKKFEFLLPPLKIQKKIASILSAYDELIENNNRRIEILEEMAETIYKEWFVHFRFPGHEKVKMVDSELGKIPEGWEVKTISDIFTVQYGKNLPLKKINQKGKYPVCGAGAVIGYYEEFVENEKITLVTCRGNGSGTVWRTREPSFITNNSFRIKPKKEYQFMSYFFVEQLLKNSSIQRALSGSAQPQITINGISYLSLILPNESIVKKFISGIKEIPEAIDIFYRKNLNLKNTRDLLLPKLISGTIDVSDLDIKIEEIK